MTIENHKTNSKLGQEVHEHLVSIGIETPMTPLVQSMTPSEKIKVITGKIHDVMDILGLDLTDDSLIDTPARVAKMFVNEIFWGLDYNKFPKCTAVENKMRYDQAVTVNGISVMSNCEHHLVVIEGVAHVSYIPKDKVLGLSKINRIVEFFSKRPQIQERLTSQIGETLKFILQTDDVAVVVDAAHYCVKSRGVRDINSSTVTSFLSGGYRTSPELRQEFFNTISKK